MKDDVNIFNDRLGDLRIAHIGLDKFDFVDDFGEIALFARE